MNCLDCKHVNKYNLGCYCKLNDSIYARINDEDLHNSPIWCPLKREEKDNNGRFI